MSDKSNRLTDPDFWARCITYKLTEATRSVQLHCLPDQRLSQGDEVIVVIGGRMVMWGTVETRFPNRPRRLTIRYTAENGTTGVTRNFGCLPGPAEYAGTIYETKVLRVMAKTVATDL